MRALIALRSDLSPSPVEKTERDSPMRLSSVSKILSEIVCFLGPPLPRERLWAASRLSPRRTASRPPREWTAGESFQAGLSSRVDAALDSAPLLNKAHLRTLSKDSS
jgi:hypothetical protein